MKRTSARRVAVPPTRWNSCSWSTRRSFAWTPGGSSPTSSRNTVPPGGQLEPAGLRLVGPGEGPPLVPEQLRLHQGLREGGAVEGHERAVGAGAGLVDGPGHQLLPRPALPGEEDRRLGRGHLGRSGQGRLEGRGPAEDPVEAVPVPQLLAEPREPLLELVGPFLSQGTTLLLLG